MGGQLPNLDLANTAARLMEGLRIDFRLSSETETTALWTHFFPSFLPASLVAQLRPLLSRQSETLLAFMFTQAGGVPRQAHGEYKRSAAAPRLLLREFDWSGS